MAIPKLTVASALALGLCACGARRGPVTPEQIRIRDASAVSRCTQVGVVDERIESPTEDPTLGDQLAQSMRERAAALGATDVVIIKKEIDKIYAAVKAEAYRCDN